MSKIEVDKIDPQSGTNLELGTSGDTITIPAGVTFDSSAATNTLPATVVTTTGTQTLTNKSIATTQLTGTITPSDSTVSLAKLTATGTKDATTFLRGDNTFGVPPLGGITMADQWRLTSNKTNVGTSDTTIDSNLERIDTSGQNTIGTAMSESSGVFTFPSTGVYYVRADMVFTKDASRRAVYVTIRSGSTDLSQSYSHINPPTGDDAFASVSASTYFNVANTTNDTIYFRGTNVGGGDVNALGSTTKNLTTFTFIRLGDN